MNPEHRTQTEPEAAAARGVEPPLPAADAGTEFVCGLGRAVKDVALYKAAHPLSTEALRGCYAALERLLARARDDRVSLSTADERWYVDGERACETPQAREVLRALFQSHRLHRLSFAAGIRPFELTALCELAALDAAHPGERDFDDFLAQKGVTHVTHEREAPPSAAAEPPRAAPAAAAPPPRAEVPRTFGALLKTLVESAVGDPDERSHIYKDALNLVKDALDRHVEAATREMRAEQARLLVERARTEQVLGTVAEGKVVVDKDGNILMMNAAAEEIAGKRLSEVAGKHIAESVAQKDAMVAVSRDLELPSDGALSKDVRIVAQEEVEHAFKRSMALVQDDQGRVVGTYAVLPDAAKFKEAQRLQEEFLSRVTHDLKAPLSAISCGLELIAEHQADGMPADDLRLLDVCLRNSRRLGEMIAEILDFTKMQSGSLAVKAAPSPMGPIVAESVGALTPWASARKVALSGAAPDPDLYVIADPDRVVHILTNLISNAIKSTPAGGEVRVEAREGAGAERGFAVVSVRDTGCGIPKESLEKVFDKFVQLDGTTGRREGVGLGLTIVRELVKLHRGRVWAESEVGRGTTFSFTLPLVGGGPSTSTTVHVH